MNLQHGDLHSAPRRTMKDELTRRKQKRQPVCGVGVSMNDKHVPPVHSEQTQPSRGLDLRRVLGYPPRQPVVFFQVHVTRKGIARDHARLYLPERTTAHVITYTHKDLSDSHIRVKTTFESDSVLEKVANQRR